MGMKLTKIERHKGRKALYDLYSDDIFLFTIHEDTLVHYTLQKGKTYTDAQLRKIQEFDRVMQCTHQAYRYLSRRPHLNAELRRKLYQKAYSKEIINQTIEILQKQKYLNDSDFIGRYIKDEMNIKHIGPLRIKSKLLQKGARSEDIEHLLQKIYGERQVIENARLQMNKKLAALKDIEPLKKRQKLIHFLQQKGFSWQTIEQLHIHNIE